MPLAKAQADLLTNPSLQKGLLETVIDRGARELLSVLGFKSYVGESYSFLQESAIATGNSAQDPYGTTIPSGGGADKRRTVPSVMMIRNAKTAEIDIIGKSDYVQQRAEDLKKEAKKLAQDFFIQFFNSRTDESETHTSYNARGLAHWMSKYDAEFPEQWVKGTDDGLATGTVENLSATHLDDLLSRLTKSGKPDALYMNRPTYVGFKALLNAMPGNVAQTLMSEKFGMAMLHYDGIPVVMNDAIGQARAFASCTVSGTTVTVTDAAFLGFCVTDEQATVTVNGSDRVIDSVTDSHTIEVTDGTGMTAGAGTVKAKNMIWALRFDETDGIYAIYHKALGVPANAGEYYGPIVGFDAKDLGLQDNAPQYWTRLTWYGNFVVHSPYAFAALTHFAI